MRVVISRRGLASLLLLTAFYHTNASSTPASNVPHSGDHVKDEAFIKAKLAYEEFERSLTSSPERAKNPYRSTMEMEHNVFSPLSCNADIATAPCTTTLSSLLPSSSSTPLLISCGTCVTVDTTDGSTVVLPEGINVEGKLHIPSSANVTIRTKAVLVQGVLKIDPPEDGNKVKVLMFGTEDVWVHPHMDNMHACNMTTGCKVGKKPIAILGGQLDIHGLSDPTCPSWTKLQRLHSSSGLPESTPCDGVDLVLGDGSATAVDSIRTDRIRGGHIGMESLSIGEEADGNKYFKQTGRTLHYQGLQVGLDTGCADVGEYTFSFRYRLNSGVADWPLAALNWKRPDGTWGSQHIAICSNKPASTSTGWVTCTSTVTLTEDMSTSLQAFTIGIGWWTSSADADYDDISFTPVPATPDLDQIVIDSKAASCWGRAGDELLLTSTSTGYRQGEGWDDQTVLTVGENHDLSQNALGLAAPFTEQTITLEDDPRFAAEVAWLTRNIIFEAEEDDANDVHGGHLIVYHTPGVVQRLVGVEIRNFGQQGILGRYPIHFHMSDHCPNSLVSKNVIRNSNQRCVVIHGSHDVLIEDNVAFDTFGHCFILEDGGETNNTFRGNLGAMTKSQPVSIGTSDNQASTFWITNPRNHFINNVAAGSQMNGYWFETFHTVMGPSFHLPENMDVTPRTLTLGTFKDNVSHSNGQEGLATYPPGWLPSEQVVLENLSSYKNLWGGAFIHSTANVKIKGGLFADNIRCVQNNDAKRVVMEDVVCMARSPTMIERHGADWCPPFYGWHGNHIWGITFTMNDGWGTTQPQGIKMYNISLEGFSDLPSKCPGTAIPIERILPLPRVFDVVPLLSGVSFDGPNNRFDIPCDLVSSGTQKNATLAYVEDPDGGIGPTGQPGFFLQDEPALTHFVEGVCTPLPREGSCGLFCENACMRKMYVETGAGADLQEYKMVVSNGATSFTYERNAYYKYKNSEIYEYIYNDYFMAVLPGGDYNVTFLDGNGDEGWPLFARLTFDEAPVCANHITELSIHMVGPEPDMDLVLGDGTAELGSLTGFFTYVSGLTVEDSDGNKYFHETGRTANWHRLQATLDLTKAEAGEYEFRFRYRLDSVEEDTNILMISWQRQAGDWGAQHLGICPLSTSSTVGWVSCTKPFTITEEIATSQQAKIGIAWMTDTSSDADYDDISFVPIAAGSRGLLRGS